MKRFMVPDIIYKAAEIERERYKSNPGHEDIAYFERSFYAQDRFYSEAVKAAPERLALGKRIGLEHLNELRYRHAPHAIKESVASGDKNYDWMFLPRLLDAHRNPVCICAGAGVNVSFEIDLALRYPDARVYILDPSPQSVQHFKDYPFPGNVSFVPVGLGGETGEVKFFKPNLAGAGSLSTMHLNPGDEYFLLPIATVGSFCARHGIDPSDIALLKFDIEGAEHALIDDLIASGTRPDQVMCEFDQPCPPWTIDASIRRMLAAGYAVANIWVANVLFVRREWL
jgi:FkbM family methyltransferase